MDGKKRTKTVAGQAGVRRPVPSPAPYYGLLSSSITGCAFPFPYMNWSLQTSSLRSLQAIAMLDSAVIKLKGKLAETKQYALW